MGDRSPSQNSPLSHYHSFYEKNYKILRTHTLTASSTPTSEGSRNIEAFSLCMF